jgi:hypothetical protein
VISWRDEPNEAIRWLVVACSVGRGAADRFSDLDMGMGVSDDTGLAALGCRAGRSEPAIRSDQHPRLRTWPVAGRDGPDGLRSRAGQPSHGGTQRRGQLAEADDQLPAAQRALLPAAIARYVSDDLAGTAIPGEQD